jgi:hypothetical protein
MNPMYLFFIPPFLLLLGAGYLYYRLGRLTRMIEETIDALTEMVRDE